MATWKIVYFDVLASERLLGAPGSWVRKRCLFFSRAHQRWFGGISVYKSGSGWGYSGKLGERETEKTFKVRKKNELHVKELNSSGWGGGEWRQSCPAQSGDRCARISYIYTVITSVQLKTELYEVHVRVCKAFWMRHARTCNRNNFNGMRKDGPPLGRMSRFPSKTLTIPL